MSNSESQNNNCCISVVIPVYNVSNYLFECLDSVVNQTYDTLEIVLVDDGSTDGSGEICDHYASIDPRITVLHQSNKGQAAARNAGIGISHGKWIAFLDSDDWIEPTMYQELYDAAIKNDVNLVSCNSFFHKGDVEEVLPNTGEVFTFTSDELIEGLLTQRFVRFEVWNKLWDRTTIGKTRFITGQISEEVHFDFEVFYRVDKCVHINKALHHYRVNRPGATNSRFRNERLCVFDEFDRFIARLRSDNNSNLVVVVGTMGCSFALHIYEEACRTRQNRSVIKRLHMEFQKYYPIAKGGKKKSIKTRAYWFAFYFFPRTSIRISSVLH